MPKDFYPELTALLFAAGWRRVSNAKCSHEKWRHPDQPGAEGATYEFLV